MGKKNRAKKNSTLNTGPSESVVVYRGPLKAPASSAPNDMVTVYMSYINTLTGSSVGLQSYHTTSQVSATNDWSKYAALYDEYRVLGFEVDYWPAAGEGSTQNASASGMWVTTHSTASPWPFTNLQTMSDYGSVQPFYTYKPSKCSWKMASTEEAQFYPTGSTVSQGSLGFWAPYATTTTSAAYGYELIRFAVQFRGRT